MLVLIAYKYCLRWHKKKEKYRLIWYYGLQKKWWQTRTFLKNLDLLD
jgi:hypothetical protein